MSKTSTRRRSSLAILALLLALPWAAGSQESLTIALAPGITSTLDVVALKMGFFARQGLAVKLATVPSGNVAVAKMLGGEADFAQSTLFPIVAQGFSRDDFRILATLGVTGNDNMIIARSDRGIARVADLRGKRVGTLGGGLPDYVLDLMLLDAGLSPEQVRISRSDLQTALKEFSDGNLDAICCFGVWIDRAKAAFPGKTVIFADDNLVRVANCISARKSTLEAKPDAAVKLLQAYILAEDYIVKNPEAALETVVGWFGLDHLAAESTWKPSLFKIRLDQSLVRDMENIAQWQIDAGQAKAGKVPDVLDFFEFRFLELIDPRRVSVIH